MLLGKFVEHLRKHDCEIVPMPEWNNARTVKVIQKKWTFCLPQHLYEDLWEATVEGVCTKLGVALPPDNNL